ncbi:hypothetical protein SELMODRAFT_110868 [Selaginella moellendorffii]|uniref:Pentacotripeptide-repeat region of PRORP domain-containing protein n=2 Tax=Selaginella moellendorffii TaxID=88036 RepID=D8S899_SELML|nr:hypothetical protein SELMODRAFT_110868 [Selaginella moellendorffii]
MVAAYAQNGYFDHAERFFDLMPRRDVVSWNSMVSGLINLGEIDVARERFFDQMPQKNVVSWNMMISAYSGDDRNDEALALFRAMDVSPDRVTFAVALEICANLSDVEQGKEIHRRITEGGRGFESHPQIETALLNMYAQCGDISLTSSIFEELSRRDLAAWNAMIHGYARIGELGSMLELFFRMLLEGIGPNFASLVSIVSACSHGGMFDEGFAFFRGILKDFGVNLVIDHYICMIDLLGRSGQIDRAQELVLDMPYEADGVAWRALLSSCIVQGDEERAQRAAGQISAVDPRHPTTYILLANVYATAFV